MEENIVEVVTNNVIATRKIVDDAIDAKNFIFVSIDRPVRFSSSTDATKSVAE